MKHSFALLAAVAFLAAPAAAEQFTGKEGIHFSLSRGTPSDPEDADLHVRASGVTAENGIRRAKRGGRFQQAEVTVIAEPYELRDAAGGNWRMWIRSVVGEAIAIELVRVRPAGPPVDRVYQPVAVTIDGAPSEPALSFSALTLLADGRYGCGQARGRYRSDEIGITLDDTGDQWGHATYTVNGEGLIFRFNRGLLVFEVRYEQLENAGEG